MNRFPSLPACLVVVLLSLFACSGGEEEAATDKALSADAERMGKKLASEILNNIEGNDSDMKAIIDDVLNGGEKMPVEAVSIDYPEINGTVVEWDGVRWTIDAAHQDNLGYQQQPRANVRNLKFTITAEELLGEFYNCCKLVLELADGRIEEDSLIDAPNLHALQTVTFELPFSMRATEGDPFAGAKLKFGESKVEPAWADLQGNVTGPVATTWKLKDASVYGRDGSSTILIQFDTLVVTPDRLPAPKLVHKYRRRALRDHLYITLLGTATSKAVGHSSPVIDDHLKLQADGLATNMIEFPNKALSRGEAFPIRYTWLIPDSVQRLEVIIPDNGDVAAIITLDPAILRMQQASVGNPVLGLDQKFQH